MSSPWYHVCNIERCIIDTKNGIQGLKPSWQLLLAGDGSPTRQLQILTGHETVVDVISVDTIDREKDQTVCDLLQYIDEPRVRRQVYLENKNKERLGYAVSWWSSHDYDRFFIDKSIPIGKDIVDNRKEMFRDIKRIYIGESVELEAKFSCKGPFWARLYLFYFQGKPLTLIYEVFSPYLDKYM